jgi:hypothetical protein
MLLRQAPRRTKLQNLADRNGIKCPFQAFKERFCINHYECMRDLPDHAKKYSTEGAGSFPSILSFIWELVLCIALHEDKYIFEAYLSAWLSPVLFRWIWVNLILLSKSEKRFDM